MNEKNTIGAFLIGGLIGAAVALLYAPRAGEQTRQELRESGRMVKDRAMRTIDEAQARMESFTEESKRRLGKLRDIGQETLDEQKRSLRTGAREAKKVVAGSEDISDEGLQ
jgi:gas vesicle protein